MERASRYASSGVIAAVDAKSVNSSDRMSALTPNVRTISFTAADLDTPAEGGGGGGAGDPRVVVGGPRQRDRARVCVRAVGGAVVQGGGAGDDEVGRANVGYVRPASGDGGRGVVRAVILAACHVRRGFVE